MSYRICCRGALLLLLVLGTVNSSAQTNHYRWVNAQGETVFSDRPPPAGIDYEVVSTISRQKRAVSADEGAVAAQVDADAGARTTELLTSTKDPELCERARNNLESLTTSDKVKVRSSSGEVRLLTAEEMEQERATARSQIETYCE